MTKSILRVSDFCRRQRRRPAPLVPWAPSSSGLSGHRDVVGDDVESGDQRQRRSASRCRGFGGERQGGGSGGRIRVGEEVRVTVSILSSSVAVSANEKRRRRRHHRRSGGSASCCAATEVCDEFATVYAASIDLLVNMNVFDGQLCALSSISDGDDAVFWAPVVLRALPRRDTDVKERGGGGGGKQGRNWYLRNDDDEGDDDVGFARSTIFVPPCVAASAGLHNFAPATLQDGAILTPLFDNDDPCFLPFRDSRRAFSIAAKATLREVGAPVSDFLPLRERFMCWVDGPRPENNLTERRREQQIDQLQRYFLTMTDDNDREAEGQPRLLAVGSIFGVGPRGEIRPLDIDPTDDMRFYEVIDIAGDKDADICSGGAPHDHRVASKQGVSRAALDRVCYLVSPRTELVLQSREEEVGDDAPPPRRLPQPSVALSFHSSTLFKHVIGDEHGVESARQVHSSIEPHRASRLSLHPSADNVVDALLSSGGDGATRAGLMSASDRVLNIVGFEENHVGVCIKTAADIVGMRVFHVHGLAAFAHRYFNARKDTSSESRVITGSLTDKLDGLRAAAAIARRASPCVLHISGYDKEFTRVETDPESRRDEEERFVSCLKEILAPGGVSDFQIGSNCSGSSSHFCAPHVVVLLSTATPLRNCPLAAFLTHEPVHVSHPDEKYARELWNGDGKVNFDEVKASLLGRSAREIVFVRQRLSCRIQNMGGRSSRDDSSEQNSEEHTVASLVNCIIADMDAGAAAVSFCGAASKLSSALIPDTHWEDVGGLAHVRGEIMDAIELPLRYPDLFAGSRRSGILLFGPPGTGKTLVAKAVATECGLPFLSVKGPELLGSYVGESEANLRAAFASAREAAKATATREVGGAAILFFDELDSLAPRRGGVGDGGGVMERVVATLLGELDNEGTGATSDHDSDALGGFVFVIGATNRPDLLDPSLLRPGRFDRLVYLGLAKNDEDRIKILTAQTRKFKFEGDQEAAAVVRQVIDRIPSSLSGADLSAVASGALMRSLTRLCQRADEEARRLTEERKSDGTIGHNDAVGVEDVIADWDIDELEPTVTADDLVNAAKEIVPSISSQDLANFEALREQFCA